VSAGALLSGVTIGYLSDKLKPKRIVIPACVVTCVMLALQGMTNSLWMYGAARTCAYFCAGALPTVLHKMLSMATPVRKRGMVFGWNSTAGNIGNMLSSVIAG